MLMLVMAPQELVVQVVLQVLQAHPVPLVLQVQTVNLELLVHLV